MGRTSCVTELGVKFTPSIPTSLVSVDGRLLTGTMSSITYPTILVFLTVLSTVNGEDTKVCVFLENCILPCSFLRGDDVLIHWTTGNDVRVHSYYGDQDQLSYQDPRFKSRTSVFKKEILKGNATLQLRRVEVQDEGRYKCYTSTITGNQDTFITLEVEAPVRKVEVQEENNRITCSSKGIYPMPDLTWSTSPPFKVIEPNAPTVQETEKNLFNIKSSVILTSSSDDVSYSCTISSRRNTKKATLVKKNYTSELDTETTISCTSLNIPLRGLVWSFNHNQIIVNQSGIDVPYTVSEEWRQRVKNVSQSGVLTLQRLSSSQQGVYTCELSSDQETYVTNTYLTIRTPGDANNTGIIVGALIGPLVVLGIVVAVVALKVTGRCKKCKTATHQKSKEEVTNGAPGEERSPRRRNDEEHQMVEMESHSNGAISGENEKMLVSQECDRSTQREERRDSLENEQSPKETIDNSQK